MFINSSYERQWTFYKYMSPQHSRSSPQYLPSTSQEHKNLFNHIKVIIVYQQHRSCYLPVYCGRLTFMVAMSLIEVILMTLLVLIISCSNTYAYSDRMNWLISAVKQSLHQVNINSCGSEQKHACSGRDFSNAAVSSSHFTFA